MTVSFETAKRLKEAGFPQPLPQRGQIWFFKNGVGMVVTCGGDLLDVEMCDYVTASGTLYLNRYLNDGEVFAPMATDILRHLPGHALTIEGDLWVIFEIETGYYISDWNENPAEAAAQAWIHENQPLR